MRPPTLRLVRIIKMPFHSNDSTRIDRTSLSFYVAVLGQNQDCQCLIWVRHLNTSLFFFFKLLFFPISLFYLFQFYNNPKKKNNYKLLTNYFQKVNVNVKKCSQWKLYPHRRKGINPVIWIKLKRWWPHNKTIQALKSKTLWFYLSYQIIWIVSSGSGNTAQIIVPTGLNPVLLTGHKLCV